MSAMEPRLARQKGTVDVPSFGSDIKDILKAGGNKRQAKVAYPGR